MSPEKPRIEKEFQSPPKLLTVVTAINLAVIGSASAQETTLEEIVVQGHRAYFSDFGLLETPQIDTVINEELLTKLGILELNEALDLSARRTDHFSRMQLGRCLWRN